VNSTFREARAVSRRSDIIRRGGCEFSF